RKQPLARGATAPVDPYAADCGATLPSLASIRPRIAPMTTMEADRMSRHGTDRRTVIVSFRLSPTEAPHIDAAGATLNHPRHRADFARAAALSAARQKAPAPARSARCPARRKPAADIEQLTRILGQLG